MLQANSEYSELLSCNNKCIFFSHIYFQAANYAYGDKYSPFLYDAVMLYAVALNDTINRGRDSRSGVEVAANMRGKVFQGQTVLYSG